MGQRLKNRNCSKWKLWENFVVVSGGSLAQMDQGERGGAQQRGERCCPILPLQWGLSPLRGDAAENWPHRDLG